MIVAKYKFDSSVYSNLIPVFNDGYNGYTITDEIDGENSNHIIRTIECDSLPTRIDFGVGGLVEQYTNKSDSLLAIYNLDTSAITDGSRMFKCCRYIIEINTSDWNTNNMVNMIGMFSYCTNLTSLDVSNFNTSNVTTMQSMFANCTNLTSLDVSNFNTSKVTTMNSMFYGCAKLTSLDVSNWDTSKVTNMNNMFSGCNKLTSLDVSNWDTSKVTNMGSMFYKCRLLTTLDVSNWKTNNVTDMCGLFFECNTLTVLDLTNIDAQKAKTDNMCDFLFNSNLKILVLGNKSIHSDINSYGSMLNEESGQNPFPLLEKLICPNTNYINNLAAYLPDRSSELNSGVIVTNATISDEAMNTISSKNWSLRKMVAQYKYDANTYEDLIPEFNTEFSSDKYEIYDSVSEIVIDNIKWEDGKWINQENGSIYSYSDNSVRTSNFLNILENVEYKTNQRASMFWYNENKTYIGYIKWVDENTRFIAPVNAKYVRIAQSKQNEEMSITAKLITRSIESVNGDLPTLMIFGYNGSDTENHEYDGQGMSLLKVSDMNTKELTTAYRMFKYCKRVESIKANWDTSKITNMIGMFFNCNNLTQLDVSGFNTSNVTSISYMFNGCNKLTSLDLSNFDTSNVTSIGGTFYNCHSLTQLDLSNFDTSNVTDMYGTFYNCQSLTSLDVSNFDTNNVISMGDMFNNCNKLTQLDVSGFNTSNVINMIGMFYNCSNLTQLDVSGFNTEKVTNMPYMFYNCINLTSLDISNFNTNNVTDMSGMFYNCKSLTSLGVSNWNTNNVTNMNGMFNTCIKLTSLDVSNWNTSKVTNMRNMFYNCKSLTSLDVSNWDTSNVKDMYRMFRECHALSNLDLSGWDTSAGIGDLFVNANSLKSIRMSNFKLLREGIFVWYSCETLEYIDINKMNIERVWEGAFESQSIKCIRCNIETSIPFIAEMILDRTNLEQGKIITSVEVSSETLSILQSKNWTVVSDSTLTKVAEYVYDSNTWNSLIPEFNNEFIDYFIDDIEDENGLVTRVIKCIDDNLPTKVRFGIDLGNNSNSKSESLKKLVYLNTNNINNMRNMFNWCINVENINTEDWNTSNVTNMYHIFTACQSLISLDVSNFNTSNVTTINGMFARCNKLTSLDVSNFNTSNVTDMGYMFSDCKNLTSLDVSNWNTSEVTNMSYMFYNCKLLTSIDVSNFDTKNVTNIDSMFSNTPKLSNIGMLYCTPSTINTIASNLPTTHTQTIWVQDTKPSECTVVSGVEFKEYKENNVMINLNSPLLQGDRIEVIDGKLCHYHKMGMIVLDGSEGWISGNNDLNTTARFTVKLDIKSKGTTTDDNYIGAKSYSDNFICDNKTTYGIDGERYQLGNNNIGIIYIRINKSKLSTTDVNGFKQWLQANPTTVVYELIEPYYEDITPIQSNLTLKTYLECNLDIYTKLPIKTNLTYLTNIANTSSIEEEINAINEGTDLTNLLDDEINN